MKKISIFALAAAILPFAACNTEIIPDTAPDKELKTEIINASSNENGTKTTVDGSTGTAEWTASDYVAFYNGTTYVKSAAAVPSGTPATEASFTLNYSGTRSDYAYCPYYLVQASETAVDGEDMLSGLGGSTTKIILPATYDYAQVSGTTTPCPMIAVNSGDSWDFKQLGALVRISVSGIPATANKLVVTFDKDVTGLFEVSNPSSATPSISTSSSTSNNVVTVTLTPNADYAGAVISIPVPTGTISVTSAVAKLDDSVIATANFSKGISGWTAARTRGKKATAAFAPSMASMILAPGNLYTSGGTLGISSNCYDHIYLSDIAGFESSYSAEDRVLFNWNELYFLMASTGLTTMPTSTDATTARIGSYEDLTKSDFGDGYSWHVPSSQDWADIIHGPLSASRPGAKLTYTVDGGDATTAIGAQMTRISITDFTLETTGTQGLLLFPDNIGITATFAGGNATNSINKSGKWTEALTLTKSNLDALISAGCAFIPTGGMFLHNGKAVTNNTAAANYMSSTQDTDSNAYRARIQNSSTIVTQSYAKGELWGSVRLVRPVE